VQSQKVTGVSAKFGLLEALHKLRPDLNMDTIADLIIDEPSYFRDHKDVHKAGIRAVRHYFQYGEKENRKLTYPRLGFSRLLSPNKVTKGKTVFFTSATDENPSWIYRCLFPFKTEEFQNENLFFSGTNLFSHLLLGFFTARKAVFLRPTYTALTIYLIQLCRRIGVEVQFDYDDLLLPEFARQRGACRSGLRTHREDFSESLKQSSLALHADSFTCSTEAIASELRKTNPNVTVRKNKLPLSMFSSREEIDTRAKSLKIESRKLRILYLSGSNTHKRDFSTVMGPLVKLAQEYSNKFTITFMGSLSDYSSLFRTIGVGSDMRSTVSFDKMLEIIPLHDLVIVPLEYSVFNHCKSNIKYIESASQGVPVIASSVTEFSSAITNGVNGWLCDDEFQWYETLKHIVLNPSEVGACGIRAFEHAKKEHSL